MNAPCICQICNCGRHKCPYHPKERKPWGPCVMSEYGAQYLPHCLDPTVPFKPVANTMLSKDPLATETTNRVDYKPNQLEPVYHRENEKYHAPTEPMEKLTMYQNEYTPKLCPPRDAVKPFKMPLCPAKFDGNPTYRTDYRPWNLPPIKRHEQDTYKPPSLPFDALPSYKTDYVPHCCEPLKAVKPFCEIQPSTKPVEKMTNYRQNFVPHPLDKPAKPPKLQIYRSTVPFDGLTTVKADYTPKQFCQMQQYRPEGTLGTGPGEISKQTTNRVDFPVHPVAPPLRHHTDPYQKPDGTMEKSSTYTNDFPLRPICKPETMKISDMPKCEAPFEGISNYQHDYRQWNYKPCIVKPENQYIPPDVPMEVLSTNKADYVPRSICKALPCIPQANVFENGPFDGTTNYRVEYTKKEGRGHCPAAYLSQTQASPDGYVFKAEDEAGHQHFKLDLSKVAATA